jgi:hypothetical protein
VRRVLLVVFALTVLSPSVAFARSAYVCRFDGEQRSVCCCPAKAEVRDLAPPAAVRDACCCTVIESAPSRAQPATEDSRAGSRLDPPALVALPATQVPVIVPAASVVAPLPRSTAPPDLGRGLFVRHCALLL